MSDTSSAPGDVLSAAALRRVDDVCVQFEGAWQAGQRPLLESFLAGACGPEREELLRELLRLERHYRQGRGEPMTGQEYEERFPRDVTLIRAVLAEGTTVDPAAAVAAGGEAPFHADAPGPLPQSQATTPPAADPDATGPEAARPEADEGEDSIAPRLPSVPGYEVLAELGRGGMGVVYQARQVALKRLVALKMVLAGGFASREQLDRFQKEAEVLARLHHPHIVQIHEVGAVGGAPFFALEFVEGGSLARYLGGTPQSPRSAAALVATLAAAMHAAHQSGVIHRDLKPANVLLSRKAPADTAAAANGQPPAATLVDFEPKVTDFGLAKHLEGEGDPTQSGAVLGTPSYMAPEQARGRAKDVGPAADVYALAAILYELLTGRPPFKGASFLDTIEQVCTQEPVPPRRLQPKVPADLETICLKGLRKEARQRYATAQELADDLGRWLGGRPILARPVPAWERAWKGARRRPALAGLAAAVLAALLAGTASAVFYGLYESQKADANKREAQGSREVQEQYLQGQQAEAGGQFDRAKEHFVRALATLNAEPGAAGADMRQALEAGIDRVGERLSELGREQGRLAERQAVADRLQEFHGHYDQVRFRAVPFRDQDADDDASAVRKEAPSALKELGLDARGPQFGEQVREALRPLAETAEQRQRLAGECVEVLLAWADAEATAPAPAGPRQALSLLDGAAAVIQAYGLGQSRALHRRRAKCLQVLGDAPAARAEDARADGITPETALDHFDEALANYRAGRVTEASVSCAKVLQLRSDHFWAQYLQALCFLRQQRWGEAEVGLNVCRGRQPEFAWLWPLLGVAHTGLRQFNAAEADFARALEAPDPALRAVALTNRSVLRQRQGRPGDAERDLRQALDLQPKVYQSYISLADLLTRRGDPAGALKLLDRALALHPGNPALHAERARLHAEMGDREAARRDFERVIATEPGGKSERALTARVELARLRSLAGEHAAALADCEAVLKADANFAQAHRQRAEALLALGRNEEAGAALDQYLKVGGQPTAAVYRTRGLLHAQQKDYRAAVAAYSQALALEPGPTQLPVLAGQALLGPATPGAASVTAQLLVFRRFQDASVLALGPDARTLSYRGWAYLRLEAARPALDDFDAALKRNPQDADALAGRGAALVLRGRVSDVASALSAAEKSLRAEPKTFARLMACVRIYARAAELLRARPAPQGNDPRVRRYSRRALDLLREAEELLPTKERATFWRDYVQGDPALLQLVRTYDR
jgi:tetratricopeptide (TPR) repeat protein